MYVDRQGTADKKRPGWESATFITTKCSSLIDTSISNRHWQLNLKHLQTIASSDDYVVWFVLHLLLKTCHSRRPFCFKDSDKNEDAMLKKSVIHDDKIHSQPVSDPLDDLRDVAYLFKLNSCASSPCLTELIRDSIKPGTREAIYNPMSNLGTLSQLYSQIMLPRGSTEAPVLTKESRTRGKSLSDSDTSSDSGIVFKLGLDDDGSIDEDSDHLGCSPLSRTHTMPDLSVLSCI